MEDTLNSETQEIIVGYIRDAGATIKCQSCGNYDVSADDPGAEQLVYAKVTEAWKCGEFRMESREAIMGEVKSALDGLNIDCPGCGGALR